MKRAHRFVLLATLVACSSSSSSSNIDAPLRNGDGSVCKPVDGACSAPGDCCSGMCSLASHTCTVQAGCKGAGAPCGTTDTCCTGSCTGGSCPVAGCVSDGNACLLNGDCCSSNCVSGMCAAVTGGTCVTEGNTCAMNSDCCSSTCTSTHVCAAAGGVLGCRADGDFCFAGTDCCTGLCNGATSSAPGRCGTLATFGSGGCLLDGEPCSSGTTCCSRVCAAVPGGGNVCQLAAGCRITGDVCHAPSDCCGAPGTGFPGAGEVTCNFIPGLDPPLGTCANPNGNQPEGNVCGENVNARHDCADCMPPKIQCCKLDSLGVPRCYGGSTSQCPSGYTGMEPCCIETGQPCTFSSECCGGNPCIPDPAGGTGLVCSGSSCIAAGGVCTATGDCCTGLECVVPIGQPSGTCQLPAPPPGGPDAGPGGPGPDAGLCALGGQSCDLTTVHCCGGYACDSPSGAACASGEQDCSCFKLIQ
jgi:hypothetical protein